jgi:hypothetical protein
MRKIIVSLSLYILCGSISGAFCMMTIFSKVWHTRVGTLIVVGWFPLLCALYASSITFRVLLRRPAIIITGERVRVWQLFWYRDIPLSRLLGTKVVFSYISGATSLWLKVTRRVPVRVFANIPYSLILVATGTSEEDCATIAQKVDEARSERPA